MKKLYIGIDIGGSTIRGVLLEEAAANPIRSFTVQIPNNKSAFTKKLLESTKKLIGKHKIAGIGIGVPGIVDSKRNILVHASNPPFLKNWGPKNILRSLRVPIRIDNDSRCFLRSEAFLGAGRGYKNIVAIAIGTGIGSGILINGKIYRGSHNKAGELGNIIIDQRKTFEQLGAKKAFLKTGNTSEIIGIGVANAINMLDPDIVILGGGGGLSKKLNMKTVLSIAKKYAIYSLRGKIPIVQGKLGELAQAIGATLLFQKNLSD